MKTRLLLLLVAAATLCGCDRLGHRLTYYIYINATDKTVVVTLYDQDFYTDDWKVEVNPDAKEVFRFVIAPGEQYTRILQPYPGMGKKSFSPPFKDIEEAHCITADKRACADTDAFLLRGAYIGCDAEKCTPAKSVFRQAERAHPARQGDTA